MRDIRISGREYRPCWETARQRVIEITTMQGLNLPGVRYVTSTIAVARSDRQLCL